MSKVCLHLWCVKSSIPRRSFASLRATMRCRIDHAIMNSGAIKASTTIFKRRKAIVRQQSLGLGIFGWIASQVHVNMVTMQLQIMFDIVLQSCGWLQCCHVLSIGGIGNACLAKKCRKMGGDNMTALQEGAMNPTLTKEVCCGSLASGTEGTANRIT